MKPSTNTRLRLFLTTVIVVLSVFVAIVAMERLRSHPEHILLGEVIVDIGVCPSSSPALQKIAQAKSLARLALELPKHPHATVFVIRREETWFLPDETDRDSTYYNRKDKYLSDGNEEWGDTEQWGDVSDAAILTVASTTGNFRDLARHGCKDNTP